MDILSSSDEEDQIERNFRPFLNFNLDDFPTHFRLSRGGVEALLLRLGHQIPIYRINTRTAVSSDQQLLTTLYFLASNSFYRVVGDGHGLTKSAVCKIIHKVVTAINTVCFDEDVTFPRNARVTEQKFFGLGGMPQVTGAVDGTLIPIMAPAQYEYQFVDRKGGHSINAMFVAGPEYKGCFQNFEIYN